MAKIQKVVLVKISGMTKDYKVKSTNNLIEPVVGSCLTTKEARELIDCPSIEVQIVGK